MLKSIFLISLYFVAYSCGLPSAFIPMNDKVVLQEESKKIRSILISEPTQNDGTSLAKDHLSTTIKLVKAILPSMDQKQNLLFVGSKLSFDRLIRSTPDPRILHINTRPYLWMQDLIEFGDSPSGIFTFISYGNTSMIETVNAISRAVNQNQISPIKVLKSAAVHGTTGGNLEMWPGNVGIIGTSDFPTEQSLTSFAQQVFSQGPFVDLPTSWLTIGHIDEVVKLLRYRPGQNCEMDLLINSTNVAISLLKNSKNDFFLNELDYGKDRIKQIISIQKLCKEGKIQCSNALRNYEVLQIAEKKTDFQVGLMLIQKNQEVIKEKIKTAYSKYMPNCRLNWIEAPALYLTENERNSLKPQSGQSIFPSLTNGLMINDSYIVADPGNPAFRVGFSHLMAKASIRVVYVPLGSEIFHGDAFDGHIHCMTQVLREK